MFVGGGRFEKVMLNSPYVVAVIKRFSTELMKQFFKKISNAYFLSST